MMLENIMYFALGLLSAALVALIIIPAVWQRAVRLTKKRIEAATPMTMAEFRADKDQLRAEFALSTRRLEMTVEALRRRLADQLRDVSRRKTELGSIKTERDNHLQIVRELEEREAAARKRVLELEKEGADLAQKLRMREREFAEKESQIEELRDTLASRPGTVIVPNAPAFNGRPLSGEYGRDVQLILEHYELEKKRSDFLEAQNRNLLAQLDFADRSQASLRESAVTARAQLADRADRSAEAEAELVAAEARIADAESRVSTILEETSKLIVGTEAERDMLLADKLTLEDEMEKLRGKVASVESTIMEDWDTERLEQSHLRERLNDIATDVSRIVLALDGQGLAALDGTLLERVQRFVDPSEPMGGPPGPDPRPQSPVSDRLKALRELQENG